MDGRPDVDQRGAGALPASDARSRPVGEGLIDGERPSSPPESRPDVIQRARRDNLRSVLTELQGDGIESAVLSEQVLGLHVGALTQIGRGALITNAMAREVEWSMNKPAGWLDRPLEDGEV